MSTQIKVCSNFDELLTLCNVKALEIVSLVHSVPCYFVIDRRKHDKQSRTSLTMKGSYEC